MKTKHIIQICILVTVTMLFVAPLYAALTDGVVAYWKFDDESGTTLADSSEENNYATLTGTPEWVAGRVGGALQFDGSTNYASLSGDSTDLSGSYSGAAWIKLDTMKVQMFLHNRYARVSNLDYGWLFRIDYWGGDDYRLEWRCADGTMFGTNGIVHKTVYGVISLGEWTHVAFVKDDAGASLYLNGSLFEFAAFSNKSTVYTTGGTGNLRYIGDNDPHNQKYDGTMDEMVVWNRALSPTEIEQAYQTGFAGNPLENPIPEPISCIGFVLGIVGLAVKRKFE